MKQSELNFTENNKNFVICTWEGHEFYWEARGECLMVAGPSIDEKLYVPADFTAAQARAEIIKWIKGSYNV